MSLLYLNLLVTLLAAPLLTQSQFRLVWNAERRQIAVDNAAMVLGRHDREDLHSLEQATRLLAFYETVHHPIHLCARVPGPQAPGCRGQDRLWEARLELAYHLAYQKARIHWQLAGGKAREEAMRLDADPLMLGRPSELPVSERLCPLCHLRIGWTRRGPNLRYQLKVRTSELPGAEATIELGGDPSFQNERWDYSMLADIVGGTRRNGVLE
jgi:hypothetical protein